MSGVAHPRRVGDRWSLLVVRDLMRGKRRFAEFLDSKEGIPTNTLTDRLKRLVRAGIVVRQRYSEHPPRVEYVLTPKGEDLRPMIRAMVDWGVQHAGGRMPTPLTLNLTMSTRRRPTPPSAAAGRGGYGRIAVS
ncbi:MAG: helix-turn-helix domain-containing protein [Vicinamibacterales bacterium]